MRLPLRAALHSLAGLVVPLLRLRSFHRLPLFIAPCPLTINLHLISV